AAAEPLQTFLDTYHLTEADADDDNDGISNVLEFILGGDPTVSNSSILPVAGYDSTTSLFSYTFFIVDDLGSVTWTCQYSTDLTTWTDAVSGTGNVTITEGTTADGYIPITITIPATGERMFLRLATGGL
ncbi:MAG: hypothetical protein JWO82_1395, partial [Akkermansiaceae bacterium]|nr:hypothetical protein [Akkermansiaceae bacterium]